MIYISDYQNPLEGLEKGIPEPDRLIGCSVVVRTAAGVYSGVVVGEDRRTLTLARECGRNSGRVKTIIAKEHIVAVDIPLR